MNGYRAGRLVVIEGIDGAGKDTVAPLVAEALRERGFRAEAITRRDLPKDPDLVHHAAALHDLIWGGGRTPRLPPGVSPDTYWPPLVAAWYALFDRWVLGPALERSSIVVCAGWVHKFRARFAGKAELDRTWVESCLRTVPAADQVLLLDVDPETAYRRKPATTVHERGGLAFRECDEAEQFLRYQTEVRRTFLRYAADGRWPVVRASKGTPAAVAERCLEMLGDLVEPDTAREAIH